MKKFVLVFFFSAAVGAQELSQPLLAYLQSHRTIGKTEMLELGKLAFADGKFDESEMRLLRDLSFGPGDVNLSAYPGLFVHSSAEASQLAQLLTGRTSLSEAANRGDLEMLADVWIVESSQEARQKISQDLAKSLDNLWSQSNPANGFGPIRDQITRWSASLAQMNTPEQRSAAADALYQSCQELDEKMGGVVPDSLYDFFQSMKNVK